MISQCARCGAPRQGEERFCHSCGFDNGLAAAPASAGQPAPFTPPAPAPQPAQTASPAWGQPSPFAPPAPVAQPQQSPLTPPAPFAQPTGFTSPSQPAAFGQPPQPAPFGQPAQFGQPALTSCPRCHAAVYPGYQLCGTCGLDLRSFAGVAAPFGPGAGPARKSSVPMLIGIVGVVVLVAAGGLFYLSQQKSPAAATAAPSLVVVTTPSAIPTLEATPVATNTPELSSQSTTDEPAPVGAWTKYTCPDKKWSVKFPGSSAPLKQTISGSGTTTMNMTYYYVQDFNGAVYAVYAMSSSKLSGMDSGAILQYMKTYMETYMGSAMGVTVLSTTDTTLAGQPALEMVLQSSAVKMTMDIVAVGSAVYMLMVAAAPGVDVYPHYFLESFTAK